MFQWRHFGGSYLVSEDGKTIIDLHRGRTVAQSVNGDGYLVCGLKGRQYRVSRIVCEAFHGPAPSPDHEAAHENGLRDDNHFTNVRWATYEENLEDRRRHSTPYLPRRMNGGEKNGNAKLGQDDVFEIIGSREKTGVLAARFGVSHGTVCKIRNGQSYRDAWAAWHRRNTTYLPENTASQ